MASKSADLVVSLLRRCLGSLLPKLIPPEPSAETMKLLQSLKMTPRQVLGLYKTFQQIREHDPVTTTTGPNVACTESVAFLVRSSRRWVSKLLRNLLEIGGYTDTISWDGFLYVLLQFCTLSKVELCQAMFLIIVRDMKNWTVHFLTTSQLAEYYQEFHGCPIKAFDTQAFDFESLPLAKYTVVEFVELAHRFAVLIAPCQHLQRSIQQALPSISFWADYDQIQVQNRRIGLDFFRNFKPTSITEVLTGVTEAQPHHLALQPVAAPHRALEGHLIVDVKHNPPLEASLPMPLGPPPPRRQRKAKGEILPVWLEEHNQDNVHPKTGELLGSAKAGGGRVYAWEAPVAEAGGSRVRPWAPPGPTQDGLADAAGEGGAGVPGNAFDAARAVILATHGPQWVPGFLESSTGEHTKERGEMKLKQIARIQEMEFIRSSRVKRVHRDDIVTILGKISTCELVPRPAKRVQGHT